MGTTATYDLLSEQFFAAPFSTLERLRAEAPVYFLEPLQAFILTRADDIATFIKDPAFSSRRAAEMLGGMGILGDDEASRQMLATWSRVVFFQDPPRHTTLRQLIMKGFSPAAIEHVRPRIAAIVGRALEKARRERALDVVADLGEPTAIGTLSELFAIPEPDRPRFMQWSTDILKPAGGGASAEEVKATIKQSSNAMADYINRLAEERRKALGDDLISRFIAEEDGNAELAGEAAIQTYQMVGAGYVTSLNQISNTVLALLRHPAELQKLRDDPGLLRGAIEEALRYEPALVSVNRLCTEDTQIRGTTIKKGQFVFALMISANRDPDLVSDPDRFDITRAPNRHLTFGVGPHYCPGASVIRIELEEALRALLELPRWELAERPLSYAGSNFQDRGPAELHVRFPEA